MKHQGPAHVDQKTKMLQCVKMHVVILKVEGYMCSKYCATLSFPTAAGLNGSGEPCSLKLHIIIAAWINMCSAP